MRHSDFQRRGAAPDIPSSYGHLVDVTRLAAALRRFSDERDWEQFHSPKNLAMALTGEVGELVEIFQWMSEAQSRKACEDARLRQAIQDELADVTMYLVQLATSLGVDLDAAVVDKMRRNAQKYPVDTSRGSSARYDAVGAGEGDTAQPASSPEPADPG
jgi:NTP pyrophosphatase (non-canonical NTP hydrolase)